MPLVLSLSAASVDAAAACTLRQRAAAARVGSGLKRERALRDLLQDDGFRSGLSAASAAAADGELCARGTTDALWAAAAVGGELAEVQALSFSLARLLSGSGQAPISARMAADAAWSLAEARWACEPLLLQLRSLPLERPGGREASTLLWAEAMLRGEHSAADAFRSTAAWADTLVAGKGAGSWSLAQCALGCWSLAANDAQSAPAFASLWHAIVASTDAAGGASDSTLSQLHQTSLTLPHTLPPLPEPLRAAANSAWLRRQSLSPEARAMAGRSALQARVGSALSSLGLSPRAEPVAFGKYAVDWEVQWNGRRVLVEVDGPGHFSRDPRRVVLGATRLKRRQLREGDPEGRLISLVCWEWEELREQGARREHIEAKLAELQI